MFKNKTLIILGILFSLTSLLYAQQVDTINVYYKTDEFNLSDKEQLKLNDLDTINISKISILAFCDDKGTNKNNDLLSIKRANNIKNILLKLNVNNLLIQETLGKGELPLLELKNKNTQQQRAFNRRAEITITYNTKKVTKDNISDLLKNLKIGDKIVLENILFVGGRTKLLPESYSALEDLRDFLKKNKEFKISIIGHICCRPKGQDGIDLDTRKKNLSVVRAKTIYDYLIENEINSNRLSYKGLKADYPTERREVKYDRRVEIKIIDN